jgi:hypothetical protein
LADPQLPEFRNEFTAPVHTVIQAQTVVQGPALTGRHDFGQGRFLGGRMIQPPTERPVAVTVAVLLQWVLAISLVVLAAASYIYNPYFNDAFNAELARQSGIAELPSASPGSAELISAPALVIAIIVAAALVVLALLNAAGKRPGRILTWIFQFLVLISAGFCIVGWLLYVPTLQWAFDSSGDELIQGLDAGSVADAMFPSSFLFVAWTTAALATFVPLLVITLLAVPSSNAFFHKQQHPQDDIGAVSAPIRRQGGSAGTRWAAIVERGSGLVKGKVFLVLGMAAFMTGAFWASAALSAVRTEFIADASNETGGDEGSAVGQCLPYDPEVEGMDFELIACGDPAAFWEITALSRDIDATYDDDGNLTDNKEAYDLCGEDYGALRPGDLWTHWANLNSGSGEVAALYCLKALGNPDPESDARTPYAPVEGVCVDDQDMTWTVTCDASEASYKVVDTVEFGEPRALSDDELDEAAETSCSGGAYFNRLNNHDGLATMILCLDEL